MNRLLVGTAAWYVRRGNEVTGPFPRGLLLQYRELGRLIPPAEVSVDGVNWYALSEVPELSVDVELEAETASPTSYEGEIDWSRERGRARRRWLEERWLPERRGADNSEAEAGRPRGGERRSSPASRESVHFGSEVSRSGGRAFTYAIAAAVLVALVATSIAIWRFVPKEVPSVNLLKATSANCAAAPAPGVRWMGCDKRDASLAGADLSRADLNNSILTGADLSGTRLDSADMRNADLRGADLQGASLYEVQLAGARLDEARWIDGRTCPPGSVGRCSAPAP